MTRTTIPNTRFRLLPRSSPNLVRKGFALVELLAIIAIIGVLMALLLPAFQQAREAARRVVCLTHLRQFGLATQNFEEVYKKYPAGSQSNKNPSLAIREHFLWSGQLLPFLEQEPLREQLALDESWLIPGSNNFKALETRLIIFQCPSANAPHSFEQPRRSTTNPTVPQRVPCTYLACISGLVGRESTPRSNPNAWPVVSNPDMDGIFFVNSQTRPTDILDGMSGTILIGETLFLPDISGPDHRGTPQIMDHWYIGTPTFSNSEVSESHGSTAVQINGWKHFKNRPDMFIEDIELGFASRHPGGAQVVFADGHVRFFPNEVDPGIWSAMGARNDAVVVSDD